MTFKRIFILSFLFMLLSCNKNIIPKDENTYFFYFENNGVSMRSYLNKQKKTKSRWYEIDKAANIVFIEQINDEINFAKKIKPKDTIGLGVKSYNWLNKFDNTTRDKFFNSRPVKRIFIIEKDSLSNKLNLIEVKFIDEIE